MPKPVAITLLTKPGCHLCDDARGVVQSVLAEFTLRGAEVSLEETDILSDPKLARLHAEDIPVVLVNGKRHAIWRVDPVRFAAAVEKRAGIQRRWITAAPPAEGGSGAAARSADDPSRPRTG